MNMAIIINSRLKKLTGSFVNHRMKTDQEFCESPDENRPGVL